MASGLTDAFAELVLDHIFDANGTVADGELSPTNWYLGLFTVLPGQDGTGGTEVSGTDYARVSTGAGDWAAAGATAARALLNSAAITFPVVGAGGWGTVVGVGIWDASTAGDLRMIGSLTGGSVAFNEGSQRQIAVGGASISLGWTA